MYKFLILILIALNLYPSKLEITSKKFEADEKSGVTKFLGDVLLKKNRDTIKAQELIVHFSKEKRPIKYEAKGGVKFSIYIESKHYIGSSSYALYNPIEREYILIGDANISEDSSQKRIFANKIFLNESTGKAKVFGEPERPVKFIFDLEESE